VMRFRSQPPQAPSGDRPNAITLGFVTNANCEQILIESPNMVDWAAYGNSTVYTRGNFVQQTDGNHWQWTKGTHLLQVDGMLRIKADCIVLEGGETQMIIGANGAQRVDVNANVNAIGEDGYTVCTNGKLRIGKTPPGGAPGGKLPEFSDSKITLPWAHSGNEGRGGKQMPAAREPGNPVVSAKASTATEGVEIKGDTSNGSDTAASTSGARSGDPVAESGATEALQTGAESAQASSQSEQLQRLDKASAILDRTQALNDKFFEEMKGMYPSVYDALNSKEAVDLIQTDVKIQKMRGKVSDKLQKALLTRKDAEDSGE